MAGSTQAAGSANECRGHTKGGDAPSVEGCVQGSSTLWRSNPLWEAVREAAQPLGVRGGGARGASGSSTLPDQGGGAKQFRPLRCATRSRQGLVLQAPQQNAMPRGTSECVRCLRQLDPLDIEGEVQSSSALCEGRCTRQLPIWRSRVPQAARPFGARGGGAKQLHPL